MNNKKVISIIEDLIFEDINQEDYWIAVKEAKDLINKVKTKQLILHVVVKSLPDGDDIWCKASEMSRDNFADWYDNL